MILSSTLRAVICNATQQYLLSGQAEVQRRDRLYNVALHRPGNGHLRLELKERGAQQQWRGSFSPQSELAVVFRPHSSCPGKARAIECVLRG
jgi:hypothetical protein